MIVYERDVSLTRGRLLGLDTPEFMRGLPRSVVLPTALACASDHFWLWLLVSHGG